MLAQRTMVTRGERRRERKGRREVAFMVGKIRKEERNGNLYLNSFFLVMTSIIAEGGANAPFAKPLAHLNLALLLVLAQMRRIR